MLPARLRWCLPCWLSRLLSCLLGTIQSHCGGRINSCGLVGQCRQLLRVLRQRFAGRCFGSLLGTCQILRCGGERLTCLALRFRGRLGILVGNRIGSILSVVLSIRQGFTGSRQIGGGQFRCFCGQFGNLVLRLLIRLTRLLLRRVRHRFSRDFRSFVNGITSRFTSQLCLRFIPGKGFLRRLLSRLSRSTQFRRSFRTRLLGRSFRSLGNRLLTRAGLQGRACLTGIKLLRSGIRFCLHLSNLLNRVGCLLRLCRLLAALSLQLFGLGTIHFFCCLLQLLRLRGGSGSGFAQFTFHGLASRGNLL